MSVFPNRSLIISISIISFLFLNSCKVALIPSYHAGIREQIENTSKSIDKFYLLMLETSKSENNGREYSKFVEQYIEIEVEIISLLNKNRIRPLNQNSTGICEITLEVWQKYRGEHKKYNTLSDGEIKLNRIYLGDLLFAMQVAEKAKDIVNTKE